MLPQTPSRSFFFFQNLSSAAMYLEFGSARATATLTSGAVSSITVTNGGFNFTKPPVVRFAGGGAAGNGSYLGLNQPGGAGPDSRLGVGQTAIATAVLTAGAVSSINVLNGGAGYVIAPYVFIFNNDLDPYGCAKPSATSGIVISSNTSPPLVFNGTSCPTDAVAVFCATGSSAFTCKWMT